MKKDKWTFKEQLEVWEAIFTIIVSVMAIWGTLLAWENGFWHKLKHVVEHLHQEYVIKKNVEVYKLDKENPSAK